MCLLRERVEEPRSLEELWLEERGRFGAELVVMA